MFGWCDEMENPVCFANHTKLRLLRQFSYHKKAHIQEFFSEIHINNHIPPDDAFLMVSSFMFPVMQEGFIL